MIRPASLFSRLSAAVLMLAGVAALASADATPSRPQQKIEEIDKAANAFGKGQFDEALKFLQDAIKKHPDLPPARFMLAQMFSQVRDMGAQARAQLERAAAENPDHPIIYLQNADIGLREGRLADALLNGERALALAAATRWTADQKKNFAIDARSVLAKATESRQDWDAAKVHLTAWLELQPKNGQVRLRLAQTLFLLDKSDDAHTELKKAIADDPSIQDTPAVVMGNFWTARGDYIKAEEWLDRAVKESGNNVRVHLAYANFLLQQNKVVQANIHVDTALKLDGKNVDAFRLKGLIARIKGDLKAAEMTFQRVLAEAPGDFGATNQLALTLADSSDDAQRNKAVSHAELNARQAQRNAEAYATLGYAYFKVRKVDDALKQLQTAATSGQLTSDMAYIYALIVNDKEDYAVAERLLDGALKAKGLFVYRDQAEKLLAQVKPKVPKDKDKDKAKSN